MESRETIDVEATEIRCDGGGGALGHPLVYLNLGDEGEIDCPYCGRHFRLRDGANKAGGD